LLVAVPAAFWVRPRAMHEREPHENSNERIADRPERDAARLDETPLPIVDTAPESPEPIPVDDV